MVSEYTIKLHSIRFRTNMGASRSEREIPQEIVVDVELTLPVSALPKRDLRRDAVDYGVIADLVVKEGLAQPYHLLETYAQRLVTRLLEETPALAVEAVDTLGAGDVFHGAFALRLAEGGAIREALRFAATAAALKCTRHGGGLAAPQRIEIEELLRKGPNSEL